MPGTYLTPQEIDFMDTSPQRAQERATMQQNNQSIAQNNALINQNMVDEQQRQRGLAAGSLGQPGPNNLFGQAGVKQYNDLQAQQKLAQDQKEAELYQKAAQMYFDAGDDSGYQKLREMGLQSGNSVIKMFSGIFPNTVVTGKNEIVQTVNTSDPGISKWVYEKNKTFYDSKGITPELLQQMKQVNITMDPKTKEVKDIEPAVGKETKESADWTAPYEMKIEGKPVLVQKDNTTGAIKKLAEDKSTTMVVPAGNQTMTGQLGKFKDDQYSRYYASGQKADFLPQAVKTYRNAQSKADWDAGFQDWMERNHKTGTGAAVEATEIRADQKSYELQLKLKDSIGTFTSNMDKQIKLIDKAMNNVPAADRAKFLAMPWREFQRRFMGSGDLAIYNQLLQDLSQESAKLGSGATASIAAPGVSLVEEWRKIHDQNMPVGEMRKLLAGTKNIGEARKKSQEETVSSIKERIGNYSKTDREKADEISAKENKTVVDDLTAQAKKLFPNDKARAARWIKAKAWNEHQIKVE